MTDPHTPQLLEQPHHDGAAYHVGNDAPALGERVPVFLRVPHAQRADRVWLRTTPDAEPFYAETVVDRSTEFETWWRADVHVRNPLTNYRFLLDGAKSGYRWVSGAGTSPYDIPDATDFRLSAAPPPPRWARDAIVYQIFPDRFARSAEADNRELPLWALPASWDDDVVYRGPDTPHQFFGGDLDGIAEHLDHVTALGANTVYLTPFFPADSNHRYNATSFDEVDPLLGGDKALIRLVQEIHRRGMRIMGDLTTNHSGASHPWFQRALADRNAPERDFYYFSGADENTYEGWLGFASLPKFCLTSAELRRRLISDSEAVTARWLRPPFELDGWRVDVANMTGRHRGDDVNAEVARSMRATMAESRTDALLVAEHCHDASADLRGDGWHGAMNYAGFTRPVWSWLRHPELDMSFLGLPVRVPRLGGSAVITTMRAFTAAAPWRSTTASWSLLGSHDTARIRTVVRDAAVHEVAAGLLFTTPGTPMVFAGDEIALAGVLGEDARRPMPWQRPQDWDEKTFARYAALAALRTASPALRHGGLRWAYATEDAIGFLRESGEERLLVHAARAPHPPIALPVQALGLAGEAANLYGGAPALRSSSTSSVTLPGDGPTFQVWRLA